MSRTILVKLFQHSLLVACCRNKTFTFSVLHILCDSSSTWTHSSKKSIWTLPTCGGRCCWRKSRSGTAWVRRPLVMIVKCSDPSERVPSSSCPGSCEILGSLNLGMLTLWETSILRLPFNFRSHHKIWCVCFIYAMYSMRKDSQKAVMRNLTIRSIRFPAVWSTLEGDRSWGGGRRPMEPVAVKHP